MQIYKPKAPKNNSHRGPKQNRWVSVTDK